MSILQDVLAGMEQYQQSGGDMGEILRAYQALTSPGKTPLGLNQWVLTDKPRMEEFNEDNRIIDKQLRNKADKGPPTKYELKLTEGIVKWNKDAACYYTKDSFDQVSIRIRAKSNIRLPYGAVIANMPEGFRPKGRVSNVGMVGEYMVSVEADQSGEVIIYSSEMPFDDKERNIYGSLSYLAEA